MQIATERRNIALSGETQSREFSMKAGAHLMSVLSGLYNHPVDAVVREYLTNMYDAYVPLLKAGSTPTPPILRVPTLMNPTLEFQDFGVGMDFDMVWRVYAEYGNSTKSNTNDEVGGFGLGSKTAFCYNEGAPWNIISTKNGTTHRFMAFVNESGVPTLTHLTSDDTGLPNGVTVSVPIRADDIDEVVTAAKKYLRYFPMSIAVEGMTPEDIPTKNYILEGEGWGVRPRAQRWESTQSYLIMGNVPYDAETNGVSFITPYDVREFFVNNNVDIYVPIGAVDIVPSRDSLKMTDRTKATICDAVQKVIADLPSALARATAHCANAWERVKLAEQLLDNVRLSAKAIDMLQRSMSFPVPPQVKSATLYAIADSGRSVPTVAENVTEFQFSARRTGANVLTSTVIVNDTPKPVAAMARGYIKEHFVHKSSQGRTVRYGHTHCKVYVVSLTEGCTLSNFISTLQGFDNVLLASSLLHTVPTNTAPRAKKSVQVYRYAMYQFEPNALVPPAQSVYYYLPLTKHNTRYNYGDGQVDIRKLMSLATSVGLSVDKVYGVRATDTKSLSAEWVNLETELITHGIAWMHRNVEVCARLVAVETSEYSKFVASVIPAEAVGSAKYAAMVSAPTTVAKELREFVMTPDLYFTTEAINKIISTRKQIVGQPTEEAVAREFVERASPAVQFAYQLWHKTEGHYRIPLARNMMATFATMGV
jgi:hypothetical protein